jgi:hypothetical protein
MYTNWHDGRKPGAPWNGASPNLRAVLAYCKARWGLVDLGCYGVRPIRGGTRWSAHAFGAAQDMGYRNGPSREVIETEVIPFLEEHAPQLGLQRIHDYMAKRYWQAGKGWIGRPPGNGHDWLHIETTAEAWDDGRSVEERIGGAAPCTSSTVPGRRAGRSLLLAHRQEGQQRRSREEGAGDRRCHRRRPVRPPRPTPQCAPTKRSTVWFLDGIVGPKTAAHMGLA